MPAPSTLAAGAVPAGIERFRADDRAAWLARRQADVTASAIAALVGEHPYVTAYSLYALKTGMIADAEAEPIIDGNKVSLPPMIRGTVLEPVAPVVLKLLRKTWDIEPAGFYYRDPAARMGATPDFFAVDPDREGFGSIQVKTCDQMTLRRSWTTDGVVEPPLWIGVQAIVEAALTGASWCAVAVLVSGHSLDLYLVDIPIHLGLMDRLRSEVAAFWRTVDLGKAPDPDYGRDAALIESLWVGDGPEVDLSADNELPTLLDEKERLGAEKGTAEKRLKDIKIALLAKLGNAEAGRLADGRRITSKRVQRKGYTVEPSSYVDLRIKAAPAGRAA